MNELEQLQTRCVSHEIRNHVSICEMYSQIITKHLERDGYSNEAVTNALECIQKSLKIISTTLLDLKSLNKIEQKVCDLSSCINEAVRLSKAYTLNKNIIINNKTDITAEIFVDENKFLACIVNIIKNAVEAIENNGEITINTKLTGKVASITISNDGRPISREKQEEIFKEGYTTKATGSGLGLHICKENLKSQNADLTLLKSDNTETSFEIRIPIQ